MFSLCQKENSACQSLNQQFAIDYKKLSDPGCMNLKRENEALN